MKEEHINPLNVHWVSVEELLYAWGSSDSTDEDGEDAWENQIFGGLSLILPAKQEDNEVGW